MEAKLPIWVATELFTMGMISLFFADLKITDKKIIANEFNTDYVHLESWLHCLTVLRNICAHYGRLYNVNYHQNPKLPRIYANYADANERSLFKQLYMLKMLYVNFPNEWNDLFIYPFTDLVVKNKNWLDSKIIRLPINWECVLKW